MSQIILIRLTPTRCRQPRLASKPLPRTEGPPESRREESAGRIFWSIWFSPGFTYENWNPSTSRSMDLFICNLLFELSMREVAEKRKLGLRFQPAAFFAYQGAAEAHFVLYLKMLICSTRCGYTGWAALRNFTVIFMRWLDIPSCGWLKTLTRAIRHRYLFTQEECAPYPAISG